MLEERGQQEAMVGRLLAGRDSQVDQLHQQLQQVSCAHSPAGGWMYRLCKVLASRRPPSLSSSSRVFKLRLCCRLHCFR